MKCWVVRPMLGTALGTGPSRVRGGFTIRRWRVVPTLPCTPGPRAIPPHTQEEVSLGGHASPRSPTPPVFLTVFYLCPLRPCTTSQDKERHARPEEVVRVLDLLARHLEDMADLGARMGGRQGEALHDAAQARVGAGRGAPHSFDGVWGKDSGDTTPKMRLRSTCMPARSHGQRGRRAPTAQLTRQHGVTVTVLLNNDTPPPV